MQENTNWYREQKNQQQVIISPTRTIMHSFLDVLALKDVLDFPKNICNRKHEKQDLRKHPICLTDPDHDYILEEI